VKYIIERASNWDKYGFSEAEEAGESYRKEGASVHEAVLMEHVERWQHLANDGATDEFAARCIADGEPDRDTWMARDELGAVYKVIIHNIPIAINIFADNGVRVSWSHAVAGVEVIR